MSDNLSSKGTVISNLIWRFAERCGAQGVAFVVSLVLARLLSPEDYGTIALVTVFITILQVFVDSGLGNALIQKKDADDVDFSSVFYFNVLVCAILYLGIFFAAPMLALFYDDLELVPVIRVLSLTIVISGVKNVQQAFVSRTMQFKRFFFATLGGTIGAAFLGIFLAYMGYGVWALVAQQLFNTTVDTLILWVTVKWRPKWVFSFSRLKELLSFGWKLLVSALLDTTYNQLRQLIIGKLYTTADLAYYNKANQFPNLIVTNINTAIDSVVFPAMSMEQDDPQRVKAMTRRAIKTSIYIMAPMMLGLAAVAEPMIRLLITDKWLPCVPYLRVFCITFMFYPIHTSNLNAIKAMGRSDLFLKLEIMKKIVGLIVLMSTIWISVEAMTYSLLLVSLMSQIINSWPNRKLMDYSYLAQLRDIMPSIALAAAMALIVSSLPMLGLDDLITLGLQIVLGVIIYLFGSILFRMEAFMYLWDMIRNKLK